MLKIILLSMGEVITDIEHLAAMSGNYRVHRIQSTNLYTQPYDTSPKYQAS